MPTHVVTYSIAQMYTCAGLTHVVIWLQVCYLVYVAEDKEAKWRRGDVKKGVHNLPTSDHMQYTLEWLGKALGVLFTLQGVFLFVPVGRGSIVNNFLSLSYGQTVKWHRCAHPSCHCSDISR